MRPRPWIPPLAIAGGVLLGYHNAFRGSFQFDDFNVIVDNPAVHSLSAWLAGAPHGIRPVLKLTYALNWVCGPAPFGFHLFNVAIHAANAYLVYRLSGRVFSRIAGPEKVASSVGPCFTALLFALHPVQTEAVTYVSGRSMSLMAFFYLASMLTYVRGAETYCRFRLYAASPALFLTAALTKEVALTLPAALLLWEASFGGLRGRWKKVARLQAAHWVVFSFAAATVLLHPAYLGMVGYGLASRPIGQNLLSQVNGVAYLLSRLLMVHRLNIDPELPVLDAWNPVLAAEAAFFLSVAILGIASLRRSPALGFGILWFFLQMLPANSVIPRLDIANERHLYLASWGIFLSAGIGLEWVRKMRFLPVRWIPAALMFAAVLLAGFTVDRNRAYRSEVALWEETVRLSPGKPRAHNNLGYAYQQAGLPGKAARSYRETLRLDAGFRVAQGNLATLETLERGGAFLKTGERAY
jgi:hypothetical protein